MRRKQAPEVAQAVPEPGLAPALPARRGRVEFWRSLPTLLRHLVVALLALILVAVLTSFTAPLTDLRIAKIGYLMLAIAGLQLLVGASGQISLGNGAFMFIGAYASALMVLYLPMVPLAGIMLITVVAGCVGGVLVGAATARLHGPYLAGATLALAVGLPGVALQFPDILGGSNGLSFSLRGVPPELSGVITNSQWKALVIWFIVLLAMVVLATISRGRLGRRMRAIRDDEAAAAMAGIPVGRTKVIAFVISAACGSLAGACQAYLLGTATPSSFTLALSLSLLAALVLGGLNSLWGALWGAIALVYLEILGNDLVKALNLGSDVANNLPVVFFGVVLIIIVMAWPLGIQGALNQLSRTLRRR